MPWHLYVLKHLQAQWLPIFIPHALHGLKRVLDTLRPRQVGRHLPDDILKCISLNENAWISIKISLKFVRKGSINNIPALVQIMAWCRPGDKPLSEPMMASLLTHICVTPPQWVKEQISYLNLGDCSLCFSMGSCGFDYQIQPGLIKQIHNCIGPAGKWKNLFNLILSTDHARPTTSLNYISDKKNNSHVLVSGAWLDKLSQIAKFMGPTWGPHGSCRPQMGPMSAPWTLLLGVLDEWSSHNFKACALDGSRRDAYNDLPRKSYPIWHSPAIEYKFFNPLSAKFCRGNINIYLHFVSFLHIDMMQVVEILPQIRQEPTYST